MLVSTNGHLRSLMSERPLCVRLASADNIRYLAQFGPRFADNLVLECGKCIAIYQQLTAPQTTHWEGCSAVHPGCKTQEETIR